MPGDWNVTNTYLYLSMLESEIRRELKLAKDQTAFTRQGPFLYGHERRPDAADRAVLQDRARRAAGRVLGPAHLLGPSGLRWADPCAWPGKCGAAVRVVGWQFLVAIDVVAVPTLWLFAKYARFSAMPDAEVHRRIAQTHP
ncbi:MAG: hypothetical protein J2P50_10035 [Hyphomicrobiaceae bacterium]|nr:hypothetical protein [Hyphomicrobiaceae bacterium]